MKGTCNDVDESQSMDFGSMSTRFFFFAFRENILCGSAEEMSPVPWHQVGRSKCICSWLGVSAPPLLSFLFFFLLVSFLFLQPSFASLNTHFGLVIVFVRSNWVLW